MVKLIKLLSLMILVVSSAYADTTQVDTDNQNKDSLIQTSPNVVIKIGRMQINNMDLYDTLYINIKSDGTPIAGFDFKIGIDNNLIDIVEVLPGEIYDSCRWEYFNARRVNTTGKENIPAVLWQMVALAEVVPDTVRPLCFGFEREVSLLKIVLSNTHVMDMPDTTIPVFFYWEDCTDNTLAGKSGTVLMISRLVRNYFGQQFENETAIFPNKTGAPKQCVDPGAVNKPLRWIEFHNGGVEFEFKIDPDMPDSAVLDSL